MIRISLRVHKYQFSLLNGFSTLADRKKQAMEFLGWFILPGQVVDICGAPRGDACTAKGSRQGGDLDDCGWSWKKERD